MKAPLLPDRPRPWRWAYVGHEGEHWIEDANGEDVIAIYFELTEPTDELKAEILERLQS